MTSRALILGGLGEASDPVSRWTEAQILAVKGAMWTCRGDELNLPYGPRPGQASNILNISQAYLYNEPDGGPQQAEAAIKKYAARGYTHCDVGPLPMGEGGYHGQYPDVFDFRKDPDKYLDFIRLLRKHSICPVFFAKPDNWSVADLDNRGLTSIYSAPAFQSLMPWVIDRGWEPSQDDSNRTWVEGFEWGHKVFPHAFHGIHMVCDSDAAGNNDDFTPGSPGYIGFAQSWINLAPFLHGWFVQNCGYVNGGSAVPTPEFVRNFTSQFNHAAGSGSLIDRFAHGYAGWPTFSAFGPDKRILVFAAEFAAFADYWYDWPEEEARKLGDAALAAGADGVLDGCH